MKRPAATAGSIVLSGFVIAMSAACTVAKRATAPAGGQAIATTVDGLAAAIKADSRRSDQESSGSIRAQLADEANGYAQACIAQAPQAAACLYGQGVARGLEAQAHPTRALPLLKSMLQSLSSAEAADPAYDDGGPARVQALVLARAPGWPVGPGDADAAVDAARRAVGVRPDYPPNHLALGEALAKSGDARGARQAYTKALELAQALPPGQERDGWVAEANQALQKK